MKATDMPDLEPQRCERCNEPLKSSRIVWLELNCHTGAWTAQEGACPPEQSQGWFAFGSACAKRQLEAAS